MTIKATYESTVPSARAEVHENHGQVFVEHYDSRGTLMKRVGGYKDVEEASTKARDWANSIQNLAE